jgi:hypothetical protein
MSFDLVSDNGNTVSQPGQTAAEKIFNVTDTSRYWNIIGEARIIIFSYEAINNEQLFCVVFYIYWFWTLFYFLCLVLSFKYRVWEEFISGAGRVRGYTVAGGGGGDWEANELLLKAENAGGFTAVCSYRAHSLPNIKERIQKQILGTNYSSTRTRLLISFIFILKMFVSTLTSPTVIIMWLSYNLGR